ncbi:dGTP triphosphohydrolase [Inquilinus sp. CA228]|uniref:dGTP triphosphohydrolase n=1 Tax=Inquilinus sp. CA228 TaxID=3455609 RepID=UPI003F8D03E3
MTKLYKAPDQKRVVNINLAADAEEPYRSAWRRDYARLPHCAAFRRLQGKTQLFPSDESDFFRNRLTHSLEVAQIAKSIAIRINATEPKFSGSNAIDLDLVETAALAHDLGHPPFGHNGEYALDECMKKYGGFEGNAQTLRILSKLEKRQTKGVGLDSVSVKDELDNRAGLNLTYRTLASVLKYDQEIPRDSERRKDDNGPVKGYYYTESDIVANIKKNVGALKGQEFKTIECSIMDVADDIAYSTYDLEDAFKAKFLTPLSMLSCPDPLAISVAETITKRLKTKYPSIPASEQKFEAGDEKKRF